MAVIYNRGGFSLFFAGSSRRVMVPGVSTFHLETGTIHPCWKLLVTDVLYTRWNSRKLYSFLFVIEGGLMFIAVIHPVKKNDCPGISKLALSFSAYKLVEAAVHCLKFPGGNIIIDYSRCG